MNSVDFIFLCKQLSECRIVRFFWPCIFRQDEQIMVGVVARIFASIKYLTDSRINHLYSYKSTS